MTENQLASLVASYGLGRRALLRLRGSWVMAVERAQEGVGGQTHWAAGGTTTTCMGWRLGGGEVGADLGRVGWISGALFRGRGGGEVWGHTIRTTLLHTINLSFQQFR